MKPLRDIKIIKKDGRKQAFDANKIVAAVGKSAYRVSYSFSQSEKEEIVALVVKRIDATEQDEIPVEMIHIYVELALDAINPKVSKSYRDYRDNKASFADMMDHLYQRANMIMYRGDKENANADSALVSTKRTLIFNEFNKVLYSKFFLTEEEIKDTQDGYYYIHDMSARRDTMNCCLFDAENVLSGGFEMGNIWYNEPKSLDVAFDVLGDIVLSAASQQYGGFTVPEVDKILEKYAELSYMKYVTKYTSKCHMSMEEAEELAYEDLVTEMRQGVQGWEYKFNTVASSRGDYPFITLTFGLATSKFGKLAAKTIMEVRAEGQGKKGRKKPVLFPKLVFLYDENLHGKGKVSEDLFEVGVQTSSKTMYPDWLSLTGQGYVPSIYKKYAKAISPMGCRAFLSPWFERGGMYPADELDQPVFVGRFNIGAITMNLPLIVLKAKKEGKHPKEVLAIYMEKARQLHLRTYAYLGEMKASTNPLGYCQGGFLGGNLEPSDNIEPILKSATASFGFGGCNEAQRAWNGQSLKEAAEEYDKELQQGNTTAERPMYLQLLDEMNRLKDLYTKEDERLYAIYGTPAENLCGKQIKQIRDMFGVIEGVSDREYTSNAAMLHVSEDVTTIEKQNLERFSWNLQNGGKIQYVKYPIDYNYNAIRTLIRRAMAMGYYEGVNMSLAYCDDCGHQELSMDVCPVCGSRNLTKIDRMNGYLAYSRVHGDSRLADHKNVEIRERKSM